MKSVKGEDLSRMWVIVQTSWLLLIFPFWPKSSSRSPSLVPFLYILITFVWWWIAIVYLPIFPNGLGVPEDKNKGCLVCVPSTWYCVWHLVIIFQVSFEELIKWNIKGMLASHDFTHVAIIICTSYWAMILKLGLSSFWFSN